MNNKLLAIIVAVAVVAVAAVTVVTLTGDDDDDKAGKTGRLQVYGNADNDDYLDNDDVKFIQDIVDGKTVWDKKANPYADANADSKVDSDDVAHLKKILNNESCLMYYTDFYGVPNYVHYPITGNIGANYVYGLQVGQTLGFYDRITGAIDSVIKGYDEEFYPGLKSMKNLGTDSDPADFLDRCLTNNISCVVGFFDFDKVGLTETLKNSPTPVDLINLPFARCGAGNPVDAIVTTGALLGYLDEAREFAEYYDDVFEYVNGKISEIPSGSNGVILFNPNDYSKVGVDTYGADGSQLGDAWVIFNLPVKDNADHTQSAYVSMQIDSPNITDADYLFVVLGTTALSYDSTIADGEKVFQQKLEFLKGTKAYQNKHIVGVGFVPIGTYLGISELGLLAHGLWPDSFDDDKGYDLLEECYTKFTHVPADYDFKNSGYYHVYTMN